jgi:hypothetical protein
MMNDFISWIVVSYNNKRELPRTLWSMSPHFQQGVSADDYEVIVVDNGSKKPPKASDFADYGLNLTIVSMPDPTHSPVPAVNHGLDMAVGAAIGVTIDGARMMSPGVLARTREALAIDERAIVASRGRYLGPLLQRHAMRRGYNQGVEDLLLESIDWKNNGYDLFAISTFDEPSRPTWTGPIGESNALFMRRAMWAELGGFDEAFASPGGGFVNLDTWERAVHLPGAKPIILVGEATFHQFHGGVATNKTRGQVEPMRQEYEQIRGREHTRPEVPVFHWGTPPPAHYMDEMWWEPGQKAADRTAAGLMRKMFDLDAPQLPVDKKGRVIEGPEYDEAVTAARRAVKRNTRKAAEARDPAGAGGATADGAPSLVSSGPSASGSAKARQSEPTSASGSGGSGRSPAAPPATASLTRRIGRALPAGVKTPLKKLLGR